MKTLKLLVFVVLTSVLCCCKTTSPTAPTGPAPSILEVVNILDSARSIFIEAAKETGGDPHRAIKLTSGYLSLLPSVRYVYTLDSTYIHIILNSGLETGFWFDETDSAGNSLYRGGGGIEKAPPTLTEFKAPGTLSKNVITNKKVLFFVPIALGHDDLIKELYKNSALVSNSGLGLEVTILRDDQCTYDAVESFKDYGLVILETHGDQESFLTVPRVLFDATSLKTEEGVKNLIYTKLGKRAVEKLMTGELKLEHSISAFVIDPNWYLDQKHYNGDLDVDIYLTSKYLDLLPPMPNTVIFGNMCFSGWITTSLHIPHEEYFSKKAGKIIVIDEKTITIPAIGKAFINRNPLSYYGYTLDDPPGTSRSVRSDFCTTVENALLKRLITDKDSTGIANRTGVNDVEFFEPPRFGRPGNLFFRHYGADDYSYNSCVDHFTDDRDGQAYKAVCIGKQTWMAENLRYDAPGSVCYGDDPNNCITYGKLYNWNTLMNGKASSSTNPSKVQGICPKGWHVPSNAEWLQMTNFLGGTNVAGGALKSTNSLWSQPNVGASNSSAFSALPAGYGSRYKIQDKIEFFDRTLTTLFSTSEEYPTDNANAFQNRVWADGGYLVNSPYDKELLFSSCRCVKDP